LGESEEEGVLDESGWKRGMLDICRDWSSEKYVLDCFCDEDGGEDGEEEGVELRSHTCRASWLTGQMLAAILDLASLDILYMFNVGEED